MVYYMSLFEAIKEVIKLIKSTILSNNNIIYIIHNAILKFLLGHINLTKISNGLIHIKISP